MGRSRYKFTNPHLPHFMTCTVLHWIPVFTNQKTVAILVESLNFIINSGMKLFAYVILENHMHFIAQSNSISRDVARFKSFTAKRLIQFLHEENIKTMLEQLAFYKKAHKSDRAYQFWQEGVHPEQIHSGEMMRQKIEYIHYNPVKRGYVDLPEHWRYSSARNYLEMEGPVSVCTTW